MNFEKNVFNPDGLGLQVAKCGCTCNGGKEHSGNSSTDNENFNGETETALYS